MVWILSGVAAYGALRALSVRDDGVRLLCAWAVMHTGSYVVMLPTPGHGGRYQPFVPLLFVFFVGLGLMLAAYEALRIAAPKREGLAKVALAAAIPLFVMTGVVLPRMRAANAAAVAHVLTTEMGAGAFVDALPKDEVVASFDIGGIGWATRRPILDIGGLSDPAVAALMQQGRLHSLLESKNVRYVVLPSGYGEALPVVDDFQGRLHLRDNPAVHLERVFEVESPYERWSAGFDATWNAAPRQIVFRIEPTHRPGPPEVPLVAADARRPIADPGRLVNERQRLLAEHMLAVLEAWGAPVDVTVTSARPRGESPSGCAIHLGFWGAEVDGCAAVAPAEVLRSLVYEAIFPYLEQGDLGGALRNVPHAIARARRAADPRFDPPLAPVDTPGIRAEPIPFGYGLCLGLVFFLLAAAPGHFRRRASADEGAKSAAREAEVAAKAVALLVLGLSLFACGRASAPEAAARGEGALELALRSGASLEGRDEAGRTALHVAAASGDIDAVAFLLSRGAKVEERGPDDVTALHLAARARQDACVARLARTSARDLEAGLRRRTALHDAALVASEGSVRALLEAGSDPKKADTFGETPLHMLWRPMSPRTPAIAAALIAAGADPSAADARGFTPLHAAAVANDAPLVRALAVGPALSKRTPSGETPLDLAIRHRADRAAETLIQAGATTSGDAWPPLHDAARIDSVQRASALLAEGADVARVWRGKTALDLAREHGSKRVEALLSSWGQPGR
jgi:ankyrin repeat protein